MAKLPLTLACGFYDRMHALQTGEVKPDGIDLNFIRIDDPREIFDRMGGGMEFDASEMSSSEFITKHLAGNSPFVALPVFVSRVFRHQFVFVNRRSGVERPKDLEGRRVGVPLYTQTAGRAGRR
jgi:4,5-dihydroxyphthalate decarboxylase